ncbi:hypothetical protein QJS04_geneDACA003083 [Acorus gramineus]|uniref:Cleavage/polyadenylation specificity factor A subunit N-terminal domain-containing protein n=1 Tax=Acorus gramineus TaxID=55184 RepID=A0AAV9BUH2_ACOGR|nr:hypothetical protein QJS04_geneDACA003083 [Acorus gramineus]
MQARKLHLPHPNPSPSHHHHPPFPSSLLFEPLSGSLALTHSDSSVLLYPSLSSSPLSIPPISTSSAFLRLHSSSHPPRLLFLSASPHHPSLLLRAFLLRLDSPSFAPARLSFHGGATAAAVLDLKHGFSVEVRASVNVFVVRSPSDRKIWVVAARMGEEGEEVRLMKCAVIDVVAPVYAMVVSPRFMVLGEGRGVRVFPLGLLVKGRVRKQGRSGVRKKGLENGFGGRCKNCESLKRSDPAAVGNCLGRKGSAESDCGSAKLRTVKLKQDSGELGSFFMPLKIQSSKLSGKLTLVKAVSIHYLSPKKFLILDSSGDLHLLSLLDTDTVSEANNQSCPSSSCASVRRLEYIMKVQMLAVLPDIPTRTQIIWISDASHSVHIASLMDVDVPGSDNDDDENEKLKQISASQAIYTSERIQDIVPFASNEILILGQGSIFAYAIV